MSENEYRSGKITPVEIMGDIENTARLILESRGIAPSKFGETFTEQIQDDCYKEYTVIDGVLYSMEYKDLDADGDIFNATKNIDGSISFEVKYYNGGCCMTEAIGYAIDKLKAEV